MHLSVTHKAVSIWTKCPSQQVGTRTPGGFETQPCFPGLCPHLLTMMVTQRSHHSPAQLHIKATRLPSSGHCSTADRGRHATISKLAVHGVRKVRAFRKSLPGSSAPLAWVFEGPDSSFVRNHFTPEDPLHPFPGWIYIPSGAQEIHSLSPCPQSLLPAPPRS